MKDKEPFFIDSNILIYGHYGEVEQAERIDHILRNASLPLIISTQVVKEFCNVCIKKNLSKNIKELGQRVKHIFNSFAVAEISKSTVGDALKIHQRYQYSFYDSLIISAALESNCRTLYSEDFHDGQIIRRSLKVVNPFTKKVPR